MAVATIINEKHVNENFRVTDLTVMKKTETEKVKMHLSRILSMKGWKEVNTYAPELSFQFLNFLVKV